MKQALDTVRQHIQESIHAKTALLDYLLGDIVRASQLLIACLQQGKKIVSCGNGGSACDAQHFAHELVNRYLRERGSLAALALGTDLSLVTAISNDYAYEAIFSKQIHALGHPGDVLLAISTSGRSPNILKAIAAAHQKGLHVIALAGSTDTPMVQMLAQGDIALCIPNARTPIIQESHIMIIHCLCDLVETHVCLESVCSAV